MRKSIISVVYAALAGSFAGKAEPIPDLVIWDDYFDGGVSYRHPRGRKVSVAASKRAAKKRANIRKRSPK